MQKIDTTKWAFIAILLVGVYLLYRSMSNLGASISGIGSSASDYVSGVASTAAQELDNILALPGAGLTTLGNLGSTLYSQASNAVSGSVSALYNDLGSTLDGSGNTGDPLSTYSATYYDAPSSSPSFTSGSNTYTVNMNSVSAPLGGSDDLGVSLPLEIENLPGQNDLLGSPGTGSIGTSPGTGSGQYYGAAGTSSNY